MSPTPEHRIAATNAYEWQKRVEETKRALEKTVLATVNTARANLASLLGCDKGFISFIHPAAGRRIHQAGQCHQSRVIVGAPARKITPGLVVVGFHWYAGIC